MGFIIYTDLKDRKIKKHKFHARNKWNFTL